MKKRVYMFTFLAVVFIAFSSCNKKDDGISEDDCTRLWGTELQAEISAWSNAAVAYSSNPTTENCIAYKAAAQAYLDALEPYGDCSTLTGAQRTQWEEALAEAQVGINSLTCD
ncbi:MAG: hypothetical protein JXR61_10315 [Prolixibacteraceae bacterium]|nr:hypothetical protein [Prolixibacteraceae bacterium]